MTPHGPTTPGTRSSSDLDAGALQRARALLATWLPGRAADLVLERSLRSAGHERATVDGEQVAAMMLGPVYRELRSTVPRATLRRELKRLVRSLRADGRDGAPASDVAQARAGTAPHTASGSDDAASAAAAAAAGVDAVATDAVATDDAPGADAAAGPGRSPADPEEVVMALAVLDGVDGVATFDALGRSLGVRGEIEDADALGRVLFAGGRLLSRHGALRSVTIVTTDGTLVSVPVSDRWIAVSGAPDMNLGAVYAALTTLEEER